MQSPMLNKTLTGNPSSRLDKLGIVLPAPPTPLGAYVESSATGNLLFLSGTLPVVTMENSLLLDAWAQTFQSRKARKQNIRMVKAQ